MGISFRGIEVNREEKEIAVQKDTVFMGFMLEKEPAENKPTSVEIVYKNGEKAVLCTLIPNVLESVSANLFIRPGERFKLKSSNGNRVFINVEEGGEEEAEVFDGPMSLNLVRIREDEKVLLTGHVVYTICSVVSSKSKRLSLCSMIDGKEVTLANLLPGKVETVEISLETAEDEEIEVFLVGEGEVDMVGYVGIDETEEYSCEGCGEECGEHCGEECGYECGSECGDECGSECGEECGSHCGQECEDECGSECGDDQSCEDECKDNKCNNEKDKCSLKRYCTEEKKNNAKGDEEAIQNESEETEDLNSESEDESDDGSEDLDDEESYSSSEDINDNEMMSEEKLNKLVGRKGRENEERNKKAKEDSSSDKRLTKEEEKIRKREEEKNQITVREIDNKKLKNAMTARKNDTVRIRYNLYVNSKLIEKSKSPGVYFKMGEERMVKGLELGIEGMKVGTRRSITVPPELGYGNRRIGDVPPNSTLVFIVDLIAITKK